LFKILLTIQSLLKFLPLSYELVAPLVKLVLHVVVIILSCYHYYHCYYHRIL